MLEGVMQRTQVGRLMWQRRASPTAAAAERVQAAASKLYVGRLQEVLVVPIGNERCALLSMFWC
ncbi:hypothetical protein CHLNCDRAFT_141688 [Chlorella variabilis]|uniref:Uncharacterized protein n=1 Tax=Chlorella variabilis TaxID=554065 RepID=E1ZTD7_CHLVA|nr:hypothetical protein CHLNCDRAFT_136890 [Chlorella variabilis]XP_005843016.1 hypothetical protein CHLNCDRAFT_141688 [Chlorella variabilis]EFN50551.1 hypothetical protein CHLNCDRAFT_136890 [Chlorella variabilis]EFN50914.1 hypothetical protein CHLNCDRAFT_141688 [Chlorella variabilis]|eukprot:XP_005842683.1 hypothetical protein CHLNCDRAFT_136890 [Chlorella variabilis]